MRGKAWATEEERLAHRLAQARAYKRRNLESVRASRAAYYAKNKGNYQPLWAPDNRRKGNNWSAA